MPRKRSAHEEFMVEDDLSDAELAELAEAFTRVPELPAHLRPLADEIVAQGPEMLTSLFGYVMQKSEQDPRWNAKVSEILAAAGLEANGAPEDLDDGLIYKVKITLRGMRPAIFREVEIPNITLGELHEVIQTVMGWGNSHLHCFTINREQYGPLNDGMSYDAWDDEESLTLGELVKSDRRKFTYEYDFGDSWDHDILINKPKPPQKGVVYPRVVKGELAGPPEDCGGIWGYQQICDLLKSPKSEWSPDDKERMGWLGKFDPQAFSVEKTTKELQKLLDSVTPASMKPKKSR